MSGKRSGKLKILMGYAAGVGKTYKMLEEVHALKAKGVDVVVGYFEPHGREETIDKATGLETVPRKQIEYRGATFEEMDIVAILGRRPQVCAVDELPHSNVPGAERSKRWEDVIVLLDAGIDVITTMNIQHLESLNDQIKLITGITVRETVPDWIVQEADEVVIVDLTPRALLHRLERGVVYGPEQAERALRNFFREPTLAALRELALREAAHEVGHRIADEESHEFADLSPTGKTEQKILVFVTADPKTAMVVRRAKRVSDFLGADCFAIAVLPKQRSGNPRETEEEVIQKHLRFASNLHIETVVLHADDPAPLVVDFARRHQITQIFVIRPKPRPKFLPRTPIQRIIDLAKNIQIVIVSDRDRTSR